jgi:hypothetical protein
MGFQIVWNSPMTSYKTKSRRGVNRGECRHALSGRMEENDSAPGCKEIWIVHRTWAEELGWQRYPCWVRLITDKGTGCWVEPGFPQFARDDVAWPVFRSQWTVIELRFVELSAVSTTELTAVRLELALGAMGTPLVTAWPVQTFFAISVSASAKQYKCETKAGSDNQHRHACGIG